MKSETSGLPRWVWRRVDGLIACGFGTGAAGFAPGTWGTLVALPFYAVMQSWSTSLYLLGVSLLFLLGVWVCGTTARALGVHDHPGIVWDEVVGYLVTMTFAPDGWQWWLAGFVLFRLFDILKPWPIRILDQQVSGGFGIMIDDVLAGIYAAVCLYVLSVSAWLTI